MRSLSRELPDVLSRLQRDGELVVTNNGQPTILMIDLVGRDLVDVVGSFRRSRDEKSKAQQQREAVIEFVKNVNEAGEPLDEEFDEILNRRFNIERELDL